MVSYNPLTTTTTTTTNKPLFLLLLFFYDTQIDNLTMNLQ